MVRRWSLALICAGALIASGCTALTPDSGVEGTVTAGPMCPGPVRIGQPCPDRPVAVHLLAVRFPPGFVGVPLPQSGRVVARFSSDASGQFRLALPPGSYLLYADSHQTGFMGGCRGDVTVPPRQWIHADVSCDTGMR